MPLNCTLKTGQRKPGNFKSINKVKKENYSEFSLKWYSKMHTNTLF